MLLFLVPRSLARAAVARDLMGGFGMEVDPALRYPPTRAALLAALARERGFAVCLWDEDVAGDAPRRDAQGAPWEAVVVQVAWMQAAEDLKRARRIAKGAPLVLWGGIIRTRPLELALRSRGAWLLIDEEESAFAAWLESQRHNERSAAEPRVLPAGCALVGEDGRIERGPMAPEWKSLSTLPLPARDLLENDAYGIPDTAGAVATTSLSRGCSIDCAFCAYVVLEGRRMRHRDLEHVLAELEALVALGIPRVVFRDPLFGSSRDRSLALYRALAAKQWPLRWQCETAPRVLDEERIEWMARAGCEHISLGIETASPRLQKAFCGNKLPDPSVAEEVIRWCRAHGIQTRAFLQLGFPGETREEMRATAKLACRLKPDSVQFCAATTYPGTALSAALSHVDAVPASDARHAASGNGVLSAAEIDAEIRRAYRAFYLRPRRFVRELLRPRRLLRRVARWRSLRSASHS